MACLNNIYYQVINCCADSHDIFVSATSGNFGKFWSHFHYMSCQGSQSSSSLINLNFTPDDLNCHFLSIADKLAEALPLPLFSPVLFCSLASPAFHLSEPSDSTVVSIINELESKKAAGLMELPLDL